MTTRPTTRHYKPKMRQRTFSLLLLTTLLLALTGTAFAQTSSFSLDRERVDVFWNQDGTLSLIYQLTFTNGTSAPPIDFVDVGLPNPNYNIRDISASVDGHPIVDIEDSPYVTYGVALGLGSNAIFAGETGTVRVQVAGIRDVFYQDDSTDGYASAVFSPTWFDSQLMHGSTDLTVVYHLPLGVQPDEPRWHSAPSGFPSTPVTGFDDQGRITYTWRNPTANGYTQYLFGASFPAQYVPTSAIAQPSIWQRLGIDPEALLSGLVFCGFTLFFISIPIISVVSANRRKMRYLPPRIAIEGHGIKRGLTAIEAAILLEEPMDKILTMILFALVKKEAATVIKRDPLKLEIADPLPKGLRKYEADFLEAFNEQTKAKRRRALQKAMVSLVRSVARKMKGFSKRETTRYYKDIITRAWAQVEAADTPEVRSEKYDEVMEWTMLDRDYEDRTREVFRTDPVFVPVWWPRYSPAYGRSISPGGARQTASAPTGRASGPSLPHLPGSDFAASVVGGAQSFSSGLIGNLRNFTSGVTNVTNPPPKSSSTGGRSGGGSSCACACAGCACACAGGGR